MMSTKFYVKDANGEFYSEDRKIRYKLLVGKKIIDYRRIKANEGKRFYSFSNKKGEEIAIEGDQDKVRRYKREDRCTSYQKEVKQKMGYVVVSGDAPLPENKEITLFDVLLDDSDSMEDRLIDLDEHERLMLAIALLDKDERDLIDKLYLSETPMTERAYAKSKSLPHMTVHNRKIAILKKIKNFLD